MSAKHKLDCPACGQDVFGKGVVHVQGTRRTVTTTGWCRQCGHGARRTEVYEAGKLVGSSTRPLPPEAPRRPAGRRSGCTELGCLWVLGAAALVSCFVLAVAWLLAMAGMLDWMGVAAP